MKTKIMIIILMMLTLTSFSQIEVKEKTKFVTISKLNHLGGIDYVNDEGDTTFYLTIQDNEYKTLAVYKTVSFKGHKTFNDFYKLLKDAFTEQNKKNKDFGYDFKLGEHNISIRNIRTMGVTSAVLYIDKAWTYLVEKNVDALFAKKQ